MNSNSTPRNSRPTLSLGGFARNLMSRPSIESKEAKTEDDLSPDSVRKLMLFQKRSVSRSKLADLNDALASKENSPPVEQHLCESPAQKREQGINDRVDRVGDAVGAHPKPTLGSYWLTSSSGDQERRGIASQEDDIPKAFSNSNSVVGKLNGLNGIAKQHNLHEALVSTPSSSAIGENSRVKSELLSAQKSLASSDSGIASCASGLSLSEALDLSVGSTNRHANLQTIKEASESPSAARRLYCVEPKQSPAKLLMANIAKSEGCIYIPGDRSKVNKRSPPLRAVDAAMPPVPPKCVVKIAANPNPTPRSVARSRTITSRDDINVKPRHKKPDKKFSSLRGTPKGFNLLKESGHAQEGRSEKQTESAAASDWSYTTDVVQLKKYLVIKQLGKGGSGEVSLVLEEGSNTLFALKRVNLNGINEAVIKECVNEIQMLVDLKDTELVIRISGWEINRRSMTMKIIMEYGECDLGVALKDSALDVFEVQATWKRMLNIVAKIHERGIVHSDLKPANFVYVRNKLKIIDFGIASRLQNDHTSIAMLNPKGTLNYISPETICPDKYGKMKIGPKSDIWSLGCILYLMVYGKTPFQDFSHYMAKVTAISQGKIVYPPLPKHFEGSGVDSVLRSCFIMDHRQRPTALELLNHPFLLPPGQRLPS